MYYSLQIKYPRNWDRVAMSCGSSEVDSLAEFASHFPGKNWRIIDESGEVIRSGKAVADTSDNQ